MIKIGSSALFFNVINIVDSKLAAVTSTNKQSKRAIKGRKLSIQLSYGILY